MSQQPGGHGSPMMHPGGHLVNQLTQGQPPQMQQMAQQQVPPQNMGMGPGGMPVPSHLQQAPQPPNAMPQQHMGQMMPQQAPQQMVPQQQQHVPQQPAMPQQPQQPAMAQQQQQQQQMPNQQIPLQAQQQQQPFPGQGPPMNQMPHGPPASQPQMMPGPHPGAPPQQAPMQRNPAAADKQQKIEFLVQQLDEPLDRVREDLNKVLDCTPERYGDCVKELNKSLQDFFMLTIKIENTFRTYLQTDAQSREHDKFNPFPMSHDACAPLALLPPLDPSTIGYNQHVANVEAQIAHANDLSQIMQDFIRSFPLQSLKKPA